MCSRWPLLRIVSSTWPICLPCMSDLDMCMCESSIWLTDMWVCMCESSMFEGVLVMCGLVVINQLQTSARRVSIILSETVIYSKSQIMCLLTFKFSFLLSSFSGILYVRKTPSSCAATMLLSFCLKTCTGWDINIISGMY